MNCPCHNCICVPVCKQKGYYSLVIECKLILRMLYDSKYPDPIERSYGFTQILCEIYDVLRPQHWRISKSSIVDGELDILGVNLAEINK